MLSDITTADIESELTAFQQNILAILAEEARYGLAIKRELEEYHGSNVNHGRLYPNLDALIERGLVEKSALDGAIESSAFLHPVRTPRTPGT